MSQSLLWFNDDMIEVVLIGNIYGLAVFIPSLAVTVRRLHDTGKSGWWILSYYLPILLTVVIFCGVVCPNLFRVLFLRDEQNSPRGYSMDNRCGHSSLSIPFALLWYFPLSVALHR